MYTLMKEKLWIRSDENYAYFHNSDIATVLGDVLRSKS